ncbi:Metallo-dependent phosphatase [Ramaria rubella]|nr:Metallo-dependent phosphatase [Ramaria rubella]
MSNPNSVAAPNIAVYLTYDPNIPPSHPGPQWTRFVCLSDTHSSRFPVPSGDVLLHSGDLSTLGKVPQLEITMNWINELPHPIKIVIAGNHDLSLDTEWYETEWSEFHGNKEDPKAAKDLMTGGKARRSRVQYLEYSSVEIQVKRGGRKWKVYGSPGSPWFGGWAFNYERGEDAQRIVDCIPKNTDILLTHGPPASILDVVHDGSHAGCEELMQRLHIVRPTLHVFGHIHEGRGAVIHEWPESKSASSTPKEQRTVLVNAANTPAGQLATAIAQQGATPSVGGPGFQPVIVDLFDPVEDEN